MPIKSEFDLYEKYNTEQKCEDLFADHLLPNDIECPHCHHKNTNKQRIEIFAKRNQVKIKCAGCKKEFNKPITWFFNNTKVEYRKWLIAFYKILMQYGSVAADQLSKSIGVQYDTARLMILKLGKLLEQNIKLNGFVEIDETYIRPDTTRMHKKKLRSRPPKTTVFGLLERKNKKTNNDNSRLVLQFVKLPPHKKVSQDIAEKYIEQYVSSDSKIKFFTDHLGIYTKGRDIFGGRWHQVVVHHGELQKWLSWHSHHFVWETRDKILVSTNSIEGAFGQFKRMLMGTFVSVDKEYIQYYANIFCFYWNHRYLSTEERLFNILKHLQGIDHQPYSVIKAKNKEMHISRVKQRKRRELSADKRAATRELIKRLNGVPRDVLERRNTLLTSYYFMYMFNELYKFYRVKYLRPGDLENPLATEYHDKYRENKRIFEQTLAIIKNNLQITEYQDIYTEYEQMTAITIKRDRLAKCDDLAKRGIGVYCKKSTAKKYVENVKLEKEKILLMKKLRKLIKYK